MSSPQKINPLLQLSSICDDHSTISAKIAILSFSPIVSLFKSLLLLFIEYAQHLAPILLFATSFAPNPQEKALSGVATRIARLLHPAFWIPDSIKIPLCCFILGIILLKYFCFAYIIYLANRKNHSENSLWISLWKVIFQVQGRVLYSLLTSIWVNFINQSDKENNTAFIVLLSIMAVVDFVFSLYLNIQFSYILPTPAFLSSKDSIIEIITLSQKFIFQILTLAFSSNSNTSFLWIFISINVSIDFIRSFWLLKFLPLYQIKALKYQGCLLAIITSLNLSCLTTMIVKSIDEDSSSLTLLLLLWIILSLFTTKITMNYLNHIHWRLLSDPSITNPNILLHRIELLQNIFEASQEKIPSNNLNSFTNLSKEALNIHLKSITDLPSTRDLSPLILKKYLDNLLSKHPQNKFILLFTAYFYGKKLDLFGEAVRTLNSLQNHSSQKIHTNASVLLFKLQAHIISQKSQSNKDQQYFDLGAYMKAQSLLARLKILMSKQAKSQIKIYSEILKDNNSDVYHLSTESQKTREYSLKISTLSEKILSRTSDSFLEPLFLLGEYHLTLNHSESQYLTYNKLYYKKLQKHQKSFDNQKLCKENLYQDNSCHVLISGHKNDAGNILSIGKSAEGLLGGNYLSLFNTNAAIIATPCLRPVYAGFYKYLAEGGEVALGNVTEAFSYHKDGYLVHGNYYMDILPYLTQGFRFLAVMRPIISNKDFAYILENGDIDSVTKSLGEKLGIIPTYKLGAAKPSFNVAEVSQELALVNEAFNMIVFPESVKRKRNLLSQEEAREIYEVFSTTGKEIEFTSRINGIPSKYNCKIVNQLQGGNFLVKFLTLEEVRTGPRYSKKEESDYCEIPLEKDKGWIDFEAIHSSSKRASLTSFSFTARGLLAGETGRQEDPTLDDLPPTAQNKIIQRPEYSSPMLVYSRSSDDQVLLKRRRETMMLNAQNEAIIASPIKKSINTSNRSKRSHHERISKMFRNSLDTPYYPRILQGLSFALFIILLFLIASQLILKSTLDETVSHIKLKKDILRNAQFRNYELVALEAIVRAFLEANSGAFPLEILGALAPLLSNFNDMVSQVVDLLASSNQDLLYNTNFLPNDLKQTLFAQDVKVYDTYFGDVPEIYMKLNTFQATDRIVETSLDIANFHDFSSTELTFKSEFIFRNSLNDLLIKNDGVSQLFLESLETQRNGTLTMITAFSIGFLVIIIASIGIFIAIVLKQLHKEQLNLTACCRLNHQKLTNILQNFKEFRRNIKEEQSNFSQPVNHVTFGAVSAAKDSHKVPKATTKEPNFKGIKRVYLLYILKFFQLGLMLAIFVSVISILNHNSITSFKEQQGLLFLADLIKSKASLAFVAFHELFLTNNLAQIENKPALQALQELIPSLTFIRTTAINSLSMIETSHTPEKLQEILLGDPCEILSPLDTTYPINGDNFIDNLDICDLELGITNSENLWKIDYLFLVKDPDYYTPMCNAIKTIGYKSGLIYLLSSYETALGEVVNQYEASNKTTEALQEIKNKNYGLLSLLSIVISGEGQTLADVINGNFEKDIEATYNLRGVEIGLFFVVVVFEGVLVWKLVLGKIREGVNKFKNVLRVFPVDLVLSSFLLKKFLIGTSNGAFDVVKNDI